MKILSTKQRSKGGRFVQRMVMSLGSALLLTIGMMPGAWAFSNPARPIPPDEIATFFDRFMPQQLADEHIAGAAVAVVQAEQLRFAKGYGLADVTAQKPVVADQTLFRTDSVGKLFVWTAVMQLAEQGKLDLDTDVNRYLDFPIPATYPQPITLKHLLSHSAGFEDMGGAFTRDARALEPVPGWLARKLPTRVRPPGLVTGYSNYGTALAGYIVERVSGQPFETYIETQIFAPLAMQHSTFRQPLPAGLAPATSKNYQDAHGAWQEKPFMFLQVAAMGEGHTTVTDMAKFMAAHLATQASPILKAATAAQMHSQLFTNDARVSGMAYGFAESRQNNQQLLRHEGNNPGVSSTVLFLLPAHKLGVYVAYNSNGGFGPGTALRQAFLDHFFPVAVTPPQPLALTAKQAQTLVGSYRSTRMFQTTFGKVLALVDANYTDITVSANADGTFTTRGIGATALPWTPVEPQVLRLTAGDRSGTGDLVFGLNPNDQAQWLYLGNNPYRAYEKVPWYAAANVQRVLLIACEGVFFALLLATPLLWWGRHRRQPPRPAQPPGLAQWLLVTASGLALLFPLGLVLTIGNALIYGELRALIAVLTMPLLASGCIVGALCLVWPRWGKLTWLERLPYLASSVTLLAFAAWLASWNLLGFWL